MPNSISPFYGINYGWDVGEDGWNVGMDENLISLGFHARKKVDAFVATLPTSPNDGDSVILPDNTVNFFVGEWFTYAPTSGETFLVGSDSYTFSGSSFVLRKTPEEIESTITPEIDALKENEQYINLGNVSGTVNISLGNKRYVIASITGDTTFVFSDTPANGNFIDWKLEVTMTGNFIVDFPATITWINNPPILVESQVRLIDFSVTPTTIFGDAKQEAAVNPELGQSTIIGGAILVPSTEASGTTGSSAVPDVFTANTGAVYLKEGKVAAITDAEKIDTIRQSAPWLEVYSYTRNRTNTTFTIGATGYTILDYIWDQPTGKWVVLAGQNQGGYRKIFTTTDFVTYTVAGFTSTTDTTVTRILKFIDFDSVEKFMVTALSASSTVITGYVATTYTTATWIARTTLYNVSPYTLNSLLVSSNGNASRWIVAGNTAVTAVQTYVTSDSLATILTGADAEVVSADKSATENKWYFSLANGTVVDQTNTSIGISFVSRRGSGAPSAAAPCLKYIPELAGWLAVEVNEYDEVNKTKPTAAGRVYFRPDSTQIWGQVSTLPLEYVLPGGYLNTAYKRTLLVYTSGKVYLTGILRYDQTGTVNDNFTHVLSSVDGGITWEAERIAINPIGVQSDMLKIRNLIQKPTEYPTLKSSAVAETVTSALTNDMFVETNLSMASPTSTTAYTRIS